MSRATPAKPLLYHHQTQIAPVAQLAPPDLAIKRPVTVKGAGHVLASREFLHGAPRAIADRRSDLITVQAVEADRNACHLDGISVPDMGHSPVQRCPSPQLFGLQLEAYCQESGERQEPEWVCQPAPVVAPRPSLGSATRYRRPGSRRMNNREVAPPCPCAKSSNDPRKGESEPEDGSHSERANWQRVPESVSEAPHSFYSAARRPAWTRPPCVWLGSVSIPHSRRKLYVPS